MESMPSCFSTDYRQRLTMWSNTSPQNIKSEGILQSKNIWKTLHNGRPGFVTFTSSKWDSCTCRKLYHLWTGSFKELKQSSDTTYCVQNLHGNWQWKVVLFDRLKPCTNGVIQADNPQPATQNHVPPLNTAAVNLPPSIGTNLELLDDDSDQTTAGSGSTSSGSPPSGEETDTLPDHVTLQHIMETLLVINWMGHPHSGGE